MRSLFSDALLCAIQTAFSSARMQPEIVETSNPSCRDYFFIRFNQHPVAEFHESSDDDLVNSILACDAAISALCNDQLIGIAKIECGFRWKGDVHAVKNIIFLGFAIKIIYAQNKSDHQYVVMNQIANILESYGLLLESEQFVSLFRSLRLDSPRRCGFQFFTSPTMREATPDLDVIKAQIAERIAPISAAYVRENELGINPAYQNAEQTNARLQLHEKKIWLLRSDFILALGNKHAYWTSFDERGLCDAISPRLHVFVNWEDRYGHPSLASSYPGYSSAAFYGGLLAQRNGYLEVYTSSGRYYRSDLSEENQQLLEAYVATILMKTYGEQPIVFRQAPSNQDYFECAIFYQDGELPDYCQTRRYTASSVREIFAACCSEMTAVC